MGKDIREVKVLCDPVHGNASDAAFTDAVANDVLEAAAVRMHAVDTVTTVLFEVHPINPGLLIGCFVVAAQQKVHVQDVVTC